jgi:hypothetical protein
MAEPCKECGKEFFQNRSFQVFCSDRCKGAYHRRRYRADGIADGEGQRYRVEKLEDGSGVLRRVNGHRGTPQQRIEAKERLAAMVQSFAVAKPETIKLRRRI